MTTMLQSAVARSAIAACFAWLLVVPAQAIELQPGRWQSTETGEEDGKPVPAKTETSCMTAEEAKYPEKSLAATDKEMKEYCKSYDVQRTANGLSFRMQCDMAGQFAMNIAANYTFLSPQQYSGTFKSSVKFGGRTMTQNKKVEGRRLGDCRK
jgi:hypothetical protein